MLKWYHRERKREKEKRKRERKRFPFPLNPYPFTKERELREEIMKYRFRIATGQLDKSNLVSLAKKNLARVKTVLNSKK